MNSNISQRVVRRINTRNQTIGFNQLRLYVQDLENRIAALEDRVAILENPVDVPDLDETVEKKKRTRKSINKE